MNSPDSFYARHRRLIHITVLIGYIIGYLALIVLLGSRT